MNLVAHILVWILFSFASIWRMHVIALIQRLAAHRTHCMRISRFCRLIYFGRPEDGFVSHFSHLRGFGKRRYHVGFTTYQSIFNDSISSRTHFRIHTLARTHRQHQQCNLRRIVQTLNLCATFSSAEWILSPKTITNKRSLFTHVEYGRMP